MANQRHSKKAEVSKITYDKKDDSRHIHSEEIEIRDLESDEKQGKGQGKQFHFQTSGCISAFIALAIIGVLFFVFLPLGIVLLIGLASFQAWKFRKFRF